MEAPQHHVPTPHLRYVDEFISLECAPSLLEHRIFPNAKEISETLAAFHAIRTHLPSFSSTDDTISLVAVGDGTTPRLAALAAYLTRWTCHSIDPLLPAQTRWSAIQRLNIYSGRIEEFQFTASRCVVVLMHAHVPLPKALESIACQRAAGIVVCPCCNFYDQHKLDRAPDVEYDDWGLLSPHRLFRVWRPVAEPPISPLTLLEISPVQAHADVANRLGLSVSDAAWLLKHDLVSYFEELQRAASGVNCMQTLRLLVRLAPALGRDVSTLPPVVQVAKIATGKFQQPQRRELLRQLLMNGNATTLQPVSSVIDEQNRGALHKALRQAVIEREGLLDALKSSTPRIQIVNYLVGVLIRNGASGINAETLKGDVVLPFCEAVRKGQERF